MKAAAAVCFLVVLSSRVFGQFYTPEVYYHDAAQRLFVVEAARVHAWMANQNGAGIAGVSWEAKGDYKGDTTWKIEWKNAAGAVLRSLEIHYGMKELDAGADFYRPIWRQIHDIAANKPLPETPAADASMRAYWDATTKTGTSRMSGVAAMDTFLQTHAPQSKPEDAAALASMMIHSAMPMLAGTCTLDYQLLARGAVWLCHAEDITSSRLRTAWPALFYLAGREKVAGDRWQEYFKPAPSDVLAAQWWECILRHRPAPLRSVVLFAAERGKSAWGLPFIAAHLRLDGAHNDELENIIPMVYGKTLEAWPDMGPLFARRIGLSPLRGFCAVTPFTARRNWLKCLEQVSDHASDAASKARLPAIRQAASFLETDQSPDVASHGLQAAADLINAGYALPAEGTLLPPVAVVTAADLILHGWDQTVDQMTAWHHYLDDIWGVHDMALPVQQACHKAVPTLDYWIKKPGSKKQPEEVTIHTVRVEFFDDYYLFKPGFPGDGDHPERPSLRNWLQRGGIGQTHLWVLSARNPGNDFSLWPHLDALIAQGGEDACSRGYYFLTKELKAEDRERYQKITPKRYERLREGCPNANSLHRAVANLDSTDPNPDYFAIGQELERLYWQAPGSTTIGNIMDRYIAANALESVKRFYEQVLPIAGNSVGFSNSVPQRRWVIAWLEGDRDAMDSAARDSATFSYRDLSKRITHSLAVGDDKEAGKLIDALLERYPPGNPGKGTEMTRLREFLPLLPALADPKDARHDKALTFFHESSDYVPPALRFILARRFNLSVDDAVKFIGPERPSPARRLLIAYLRKDEKDFIAAYALVKRKLGPSIDETCRTLIECLNHEVQKIAPIPTQPDIKPAKVEMLDDLVRQKLEP